MGKNSTIEWTNHTFNPWWGCAKISEACENCYAEKWAKRVGVEIWGLNSERRFFGEKHWKEPLLWNKIAQNNRTRSRVFCASMADVFEDRIELDQWRNKLWSLISDTPWLNWLLLTKRSEQIKNMVPWGHSWPDNVWIGITVENQEIANIRIPYLIELPAKVRFISCEPLLGPIDLTAWFKPSISTGIKNSIDWVIVGGESGGEARPSFPSWIINLKNQCVNANTPFLFKQWGCWCPANNGVDGKSKKIIIDSDGAEKTILVKKNKKVAGRNLQGKVFDGYPE